MRRAFNVLIFCYRAYICLHIRSTFRFSGRFKKVAPLSHSEEKWKMMVFNWITFVVDSECKAGIPLPSRRANDTSERAQTDVFDRLHSQHHVFLLTSGRLHSQKHGIVPSPETRFVGDFWLVPYSNWMILLNFWKVPVDRTMCVLLTFDRFHSQNHRFVSTFDRFHSQKHLLLLTFDRLHCQNQWFLLILDWFHIQNDYFVLTFSRFHSQNNLCLLSFHRWRSWSDETVGCKDACAFGTFGEICETQCFYSCLRCDTFAWFPHTRCTY